MAHIATLLLTFLIFSVRAIYFAIAGKSGSIFLSSSTDDSKYDDLCLLDPCYNNAVCKASAEAETGYICNCQYGYIGDFCDTNPCWSKPCKNGGICTPDVGTAKGYVCACKLGYRGDVCEHSVQFCEQIQCPKTDCMSVMPKGAVKTQGAVCICKWDTVDEICQIKGMSLRERFKGDPCTRNGKKCRTGEDCMGVTTKYVNGQKLVSNPAWCMCSFGHVGRLCNASLPVMVDSKKTDCVHTTLGPVCLCQKGKLSTLCIVDELGQQKILKEQQLFDYKNPCLLKPCLNNGRCILRTKAEARYICKCHYRYTGDFCEYDPCLAKPCKNNGICTPDIGGETGYVCACKLGYRGDVCESKVQICEHILCHKTDCMSVMPKGAVKTKGAICICKWDTVNEICQIKGMSMRERFKGDPCTSDGNKCRTGEDCMGVTTKYGRKLPASQALCMCSFGRGGLFCNTSLPIMVYSKKTDCVHTTLGPVCLCQKGKFSTLCRVDELGQEKMAKEQLQIDYEDPCLLNPCLNNGVCKLNTKVKTGYICKCQYRYTGDFCELDPCLSQPCINKGVCTPDIGTEKGFVCACPPGYGGDTCDSSLLVCEHSKWPMIECMSVTPGSAICLYKYDRVDEICQVKGMSSRERARSDPCKSKNKCRTRQDCIGVWTKYVDGKELRANLAWCMCPLGYSGRFCRSKLPIIEDSKKIDCAHTTVGPVCICQKGKFSTLCRIDELGQEKISKDQLQIDKNDPCLFKPCFNHGVCKPNEKSKTGYICRCQFGNIGDFCEIDPCRSIPCKNKGVCTPDVATEKGYICVCRLGSRGDICEQALQVCEHINCPARTDCMSVSPRRAICICRWGDVDEMCVVKGMHPIEIARSDPCKSNNKCRAGEDCMAVWTKYTNGIKAMSNPNWCMCPLGYGGKLCKSLPVMADSKKKDCLVTTLNPVCICQKGRLTTICQVNLLDQQITTQKQLLLDYDDPCHLTPCLNNGACMPDVTNDEIGYICRCPYGYIGDFCEYDPCLSEPCKNNGMCTPDVIAINGYICECQLGYRGDSCESRAQICENIPCPKTDCASLKPKGAVCICRGDIVNEVCRVKGMTKGEIARSSPCNKKNDCRDYEDCVGVWTKYTNGVQAMSKQAWCMCPFGYGGKRCKSLRVLQDNKKTDCIHTTLGPVCMCQKDSRDNVTLCRVDIEKQKITATEQLQLAEKQVKEKKLKEQQALMLVEKQNRAEILKIQRERQLAEKRKHGEVSKENLEHELASELRSENEGNRVVRIIPLSQSGPPEEEDDPCISSPCINRGICRRNLTSQKKKFHCVCPLEYRGVYCNESMRDCHEVSCIKKSDCVSTPFGALCVCDNADYDRLCQVKMKNTTQWERIQLVISKRTRYIGVIILGVIAGIILLLFTCLIVHCCKVYAKRLNVHENYQNILQRGIVPDEPPPDWMDISNDMCLQNLCCGMGSSIQTNFTTQKSTTKSKHRLKKDKYNTSLINIPEEKDWPPIATQPIGQRSKLNLWKTESLKSYAISKSKSQINRSSNAWRPSQPRNVSKDKRGKRLSNGATVDSKRQYPVVKFKTETKPETKPDANPDVYAWVSNQTKLLVEGIRASDNASSKPVYPHHRCRTSSYK